MKTEPFIDSFREINHRFFDLIGVLSALSSLSSLKTDTDSEIILLKNALKTLTENLDLERCSVFLLDGNKLECATGLDWDEMTSQSVTSKEHKSMVFNIGEGIIGQAVANDRIIVVPDCAADSRVVPQKGENDDNKVVIGSLISVPIRSSSKILGVLNVSHPDTAHFNETHERLLTLFSNFLGQMLANWRHVHKMGDLVREQTQQLEYALDEAQKLKERYQALSVIDELTGLHNRRFFFPEAQSVLARAIRYQQLFSVMVIDIDRFKEINDSLGHVAGDYVLERVARILEKQMRDADMLCRFGGEEFMLAMPNTNAEDAKNLAERIQNTVHKTDWNYDGKPMRITMTFGVTDTETIDNLVNSKKETSEMLEELIKQADRAMYFGKENGRDQISVFKDIVCKL